MNDSNSQKPIRPPASDNEKGLARGITEGVIELIPGMGIITNIISVTHPSEAEQAQETWQTEISERTNDNTTRIDKHEELLQPHHETLNGVIASLVYHLAHDCSDGLGHKIFSLENILAMLPNEASQEVEDAIYELENFGFLKVSRVLSGKWHARLTQSFYEQFDYQIMGWNTENDAVTIVQKMLELNNGDAPTLHKETGWEKRRFNPAFRRILELFPEGRIRRTMQPDYPSLGVCIAPEDRVVMRRFVKR